MVTLGDPACIEKALLCVKEGTKTGCWVVLENCHLANNWSKEFVQQLHVRHKSELENLLLFCYCCVSLLKNASKIPSIQVYCKQMAFLLMM